MFLEPDRRLHLNCLAALADGLQTAALCGPLDLTDVGSIAARGCQMARNFDDIGIDYGRRVSLPRDGGTHAVDFVSGVVAVAADTLRLYPLSADYQSLLVSGTADVVGAALIAATVFLCYRYADRLLRLLGETGTSVLIRFSAFIMLCIGVQIFWTGAAALLATLPGDALR